MGLYINKSIKECVGRTNSRSLIYQFWKENYNYDDGSLYIEDEESLKQMLHFDKFTEQEQNEIIKFYQDNNLYGFDVDIN